MPHIFSLSWELVFMITEYLPVRDLAAVICTHRTYQHLKPYLLKVDAQSKRKALRRAVRNRDLDFIHDACEAYKRAGTLEIAIKLDCEGLIVAAASRGHMDVVRGLLAYNFLPNAKDRVGKTSMHYAAIDNDSETIIALFNAGGNVDTPDGIGSTPLHHASKAGATKSISVLLSFDANVDIQNIVDMAPLHYAARFNHLEAVEELLAYGADTTSRTENAIPPILEAARTGNPQLVAVFLSHGVDPYIPDTAGATILHYAAKNYDSNLIRFLHSRLTLSLDIQDSFGQTPLHYAVKSSQCRVIHTLLDLGVNINARDFQNNTPLLFAAKDGDMAAVRLLIERGADMNIKNQSGFTPYCCAVENENLRMANLFLDYGYTYEAGPIATEYCHRTIEVMMLLAKCVPLINKEGKIYVCLAAAKLGLTDIVREIVASPDMPHPINYQVLAAAAAQGRRDLVTVLLTYEANTDPAIDEEKQATALHHAAEKNHWSIVMALLASGANVNATLENGTTPLHLAAKSCNINITRSLLTYSADVSARDTDGFTPLHYAAQASNRPIVRALLIAGSDGNSITTLKRTVLHYAASTGSSGVVSDLLDNGIDIHATCNTGKTALHYAAEYGQLSATTILANAGIDVNAVDNCGRTAHHFAADFGHYATLDELFYYGANFQAEDNMGQTVFHYAFRKICHPLICVLLRRTVNLELSLESRSVRHALQEAHAEYHDCEFSS